MTGKHFRLKNTSWRALRRRQTAADAFGLPKAVQRNLLTHARHSCEWREDGQSCGLHEGAIDPIGGGTVKLTPDHVTPHAVDPDSDPGIRNSGKRCAADASYEEKFLGRSNGKN